MTHVQAYTFGYDRENNLIFYWATAVGARFTNYGVGKALERIYGSNPVGASVFFRLRPFEDQ